MTGRSCLWHCFEWECELALEYGKSDESQLMGIKDSATDFQTKNGRMGGSQEKNFERNESQVADDQFYLHWLNMLNKHGRQRHWLLVMEALRSMLRGRTATLVMEQECLGLVDPVSQGGADVPAEGSSDCGPLEG